MKARGVQTGVVKYDGQGELAGHRFHLRTDHEGKGVLMIDAAKLLFLNGTALDYVRLMLEGKDEKGVAKAMRRKYRGLSKREAVEDFGEVKGQLLAYIAGDDAVIERTAPDSPTVGVDQLPSPYRMDLALTYRCQNRCGHCYNEEREVPELGLEQWMQVLNKLWREGIPHIVFTGGEPTLVPFLKELIAKSEKLGQITGLITNGRRLGEPGYVKGLVDAGLDHAQITLLSHRESVHDKLAGSEGAWAETVEGIKAALAEDLYVSTNTTIMRTTLPEIEETIRFLMSLGVRNVSFNSIIRSGKGKSAEAIDFDELARCLERLKSIADDEDINLIWYSPTPYCEFNPINYGLGIKQCTACAINMAIEPDGTVLPCQSYYKPLGNVLKDPWQSIWNHELCANIRERAYMPDKCKECNLWDLCGGGCPLALEHGDYVCLERHSSP